MGHHRVRDRVPRRGGEVQERGRVLDRATEETYRRQQQVRLPLAWRQRVKQCTNPGAACNGLTQRLIRWRHPVELTLGHRQIELSGTAPQASPVSHQMTIGIPPNTGAPAPAGLPVAGRELRAVLMTRRAGPIGAQEIQVLVMARTRHARDTSQEEAPGTPHPQPESIWISEPWMRATMRGSSHAWTEAPPYRAGCCVPSEPTTASLLVQTGAMRFLEVAGLGQVSRVGLGTWQFGSREWGYGESYASGAAGEIVARARELGVTLFDTAEIYGFGRSERILGRALGADRDQVVVASKVFPVAPFPAVVRNRAQASARRLQLRRIPLYQIHQPNPLVPDSVIMPGMRSLLQD